MLQQTSKYTQKPKHRLTTLFLLLLWLAALYLVGINRQNIIDWWRLRHYQAPSTIAQLATEDTMTGYARKVFYVNHTAISPKDSFSDQCPDNGGEQTIVLGCYHSDQAGIFLLSVTDARLNGVEQVTAAHEMLHAAYDRLNSSEKDRVNAMLLDYYHNDLHDNRIQKTIESYKKTEPNDLVNEMHSIFGTEVVNLPAGLERYYKRYFDNRAQVAAYAAQYEGEFTSRQAVVTQDDTQLAALKQQIESQEADLNTKQASISSQKDALTSQRDSGDIAGYNAGIPGYNALIDGYNAEVDSVQALIDQYNALVGRRNAIAFEVDQLSKELSSKASTIQH